MNRLRVFPIKPDDYSPLNDIRNLPSLTTLVLILTIYTLIQPLLPHLPSLISSSGTATNPGKPLINIGVSVFVSITSGLFFASILLGISCKRFLSYPTRFIRKHNLQLLPEDHAAHTAILKFSQLLNINYPIAIYQAIGNQVDTQVFGTFRNRYLALSRKHIELFEHDSEWADVLICHELAHLSSGDHWKWSLTRHIITSAMILWYTFTILGVVVIDEIWIGSPLQIVENLLPAFLIILMSPLLYLCTILIKNIREAYADHLTSDTLHISLADIIATRYEIDAHVLDSECNHISFSERLENAIARHLARSRIFRIFSVKLHAREKLVGSSRALVLLLGLLTGASTFNFGGTIDSAILLLSVNTSIATISILIHSLYHLYGDNMQQGIGFNNIYQWLMLFFGGSIICVAAYTIIRALFELFFDFPMSLIIANVVLSAGPAILFLLFIPLLIFPTIIALKMVIQSAAIFNTSQSRWEKSLIVIGVPTLISIAIFTLSVFTIYTAFLIVQYFIVEQAQNSSLQIANISFGMIILLVPTMVITLLYPIIFQKFARSE